MEERPQALNLPPPQARGIIHPNKGKKKSNSKLYQSPRDTILELAAPFPFHIVLRQKLAIFRTFFVFSSILKISKITIFLFLEIVFLASLTSYCEPPMEHLVLRVLLATRHSSSPVRVSEMSQYFFKHYVRVSE